MFTQEVGWYWTGPTTARRVPASVVTMLRITPPVVGEAISSPVPERIGRMGDTRLWWSQAKAASYSLCSFRWAFTSWVAAAFEPNVISSH